MGKLEVKKYPYCLKNIMVKCHGRQTQRNQRIPPLSALTLIYLQLFLLTVCSADLLQPRADLQSRTFQWLFHRPSRAVLFHLDVFRRTLISLFPWQTFISPASLLMCQA